MTTGALRLSILRGAESMCLAHGVDSFTLSELARAIGEPRDAVQKLFHNEVAILDAVLDRHQAPYEHAWESIFPTLETPRDTMRMLVTSIARLIHDEDGGPAYLAVACQMCTSARYPLTGRPATTTPAALKLMGKLMTSTAVPFELIPMRFERFAVVLFSSVFAWYRHGAARASEAVFIEDLVDTLASIALAGPSSDTQRVLSA